MTHLADIQQLLGGAFRSFTPLQEQPTLHPALLSCVSGNDRLTPLEQADIYRRQFWLRHRDVLREDYPTLRYWLDDEGFEALCEAYLSALPPNSYTLRDLGDRLAEFAASYPHFAPDRGAVARELASFELAMVNVFDGPDVAPVAAEALTEITPDAWPHVRLTLHPVLTVLSLDYPVYRLRRAIMANEKPERVLAPKASFLALWRGEELKVHYRLITVHELRLIDAVRAGATLGAACEAVVAGLDDAEQIDVVSRLGAWFQGWTLRGWVTGVEVAPAAQDGPGA